MEAKAWWYRLRTRERESSPKTSIGYSIRSSRPSPMAWGWACRFAARSSRPTKAGCGLRRMPPGARCSNSPCEPTIRRPPVFDRYLERPGHSYQFGDRSGAHLLHDLAPMDLYRNLADAQLGRGLLVEKAAHDQGQNLAFARREARKAPTQLGQLGSLLSGLAILCDGGMD